MQTNGANLAIEVEGVCKRIGKRLILDDVRLEVPEGQIYGITGPNGAGKSMLLRVICGLVLPTDGRVSVFGEEIGKEVEFPQETGALIETPVFLRHYNGFANLWLLAMLRAQITKEEIASTIRLVGLDPDDPRPVRTYSTGMRQRLGIAQALMEKPRLLVLDELTKGLDREGVRDVHRLLKGLQSEGKTILLTSHSKEEIQNLCDAVFLIEKGHLDFLQPQFYSSRL